MKTIPISKFGKDHWSLLAYVECRCVDNQGVLKLEHLRVNPKTHPQHVHCGFYMLGCEPKGFPYPTRLQNGKTAKGHDDWDCLYDLEMSGLIKHHGTGINPTFALTVKGWRLTYAIRRHKAKGGTFASFVPKEE